MTLSLDAIAIGLPDGTVLAKDAGIADDAAGVTAAVLRRDAGSRDEVDALLAAAESAGGRIAASAGETENGDYAGHFTDPDGIAWKATSA